MPERLANLAFDTTLADWEAAEHHSHVRAPPAPHDDLRGRIILLAITALPVVVTLVLRQPFGLVGWFFFFLVYGLFFSPNPTPSRDNRYPEDPIIPLLLELFPDYLVCARGEHRYLFANWTLCELLEWQGRFLVCFATWRESVVTLPIPVAIFERADEVRALLDGLQQRAARAIETGRRSLALDDVRARDEIQQQITFELTTGDVARVWAGNYRLPGGNPWLRGPLATSVLIFLAAAGWSIMPYLAKPDDRQLLSGAACFFSAWVLHNLVIAWQLHVATPEEAHIFEVGLTPRAVIQNNGEFAARESWLLIDEIDYRDDFLVFRQRGLTLLFVPRTAFATTAEAEHFLFTAQRLWKGANPAFRPALLVAPIDEAPAKLRKVSETGNPYQTPWADL